MNNEDIQKILNRFGNSDIGKANATLLSVYASRKKFHQYDFDGNLIKVWNHFSELEDHPVFKKQSISQCCVKQKGIAFGYVWRYAKDWTLEELNIDKDELVKYNYHAGLSISKYDLQGNLIKNYESVNLAFQDLHVKNYHTLIQILKENPDGFKMYDFIWSGEEKKFTEKELQTIINTEYSSERLPIGMFDLQGKLIKILGSKKQAADYFKVSPSTIRNILNGKKNCDGLTYILKRFKP
jgi:hypothetical protein